MNFTLLMHPSLQCSASADYWVMALIRSYLLELRLMRFPQLNRVSRCQEESGNVTNVGGPTDISTDIDGKARDKVRETGS